MKYNETRSWSIPWLSTPDICGVFISYAETLWIGDSLTRHSILALYMLLTENYRTGGYPIYPSLPETIYNRCNCDGQFSEHFDCRDYQAGEVNLQHPLKKGLCPFDEHFRGFHFNAGSSSVNHTKPLLPYLCSAEDRLRMVYLQGGAHFNSNADLFFREYIHPTIEEIIRIVRTCAHPISFKIRMIISGIGACDNFLQQKYPHQNTKAVIAYNARLKELVKMNFPTLPIVMIDFLKVTERAIADGRTSDGYHFLSDVNLIKVMSILNIMEQMAVDKSFNVSFS